METIIPQQQADISVDQLPDILQKLVYEVLDGKPIFYKGYEEVLRGQKTLDDIMGTSGLQALIISCIVEFLLRTLPRKDYKVLYNELGLHLGKNDNHALDVAVYKRELLKEVDGKYMELAPTLVFEVDTKADLNTFSHPMDYLNIKTQKLLDYGVEEVIWVLSKSKMVVVAKPNADWLIKSINDEFQVLETYDFNLGKLLDEEDINIKD